MVGAINIKHHLNNYLLLRGGHIGYGVRPFERRKGIATSMLALALKDYQKIGMDRLLITCDKDNISSAKTIVHNG